MGKCPKCEEEITYLNCKVSHPVMLYRGNGNYDEPEPRDDSIDGYTCPECEEEIANDEYDADEILNPTLCAQCGNKNEPDCAEEHVVRYGHDFVYPEKEGGNDGTV